MNLIQNVRVLEMRRFNPARAQHKDSKNLDSW
jgi:hypothetical protein